MPIQKRSLVVVVREMEALFFVVSENDFQRVQTVPLLTLTKTLRAFSLRHRAVRDIYLIIDDIPVYHSLLTEVQRKKEDLGQLWECADLFAYREIFRENKYLYMGYSYAETVLQKYIAILKKTGLSCKGIIPADFLYQGAPLCVIQSNHRLRLRLFDGQGGIFATTMLRAPTAQKDVDQIGQYAVREKIILPVTLQKATALYEPESLLALFYEHLTPSIILYTQESQALHTRVRLNTVQKTMLAFIVLVIGLVLLSFAWFGFKVNNLRQELRFIKHQLEQLLPQANRLRELETKTLWLKKLGPKVSPELATVLGFIQQSQGLVSELNYVVERKLMSVVVLDVADNRNSVIRACQESRYFSAVNLIYIRPQGRYLEYKLILTVR